MKTIDLTQRKVALVDDEDFELLSRWKWYALRDHATLSFYAVRHTKATEGQKMVHMHRVILGLEYGDKRLGDHINRDTLDNRRRNLRIATPAENCWNRGKQSNNKSGFKGVCYYKRSAKWVARIMCAGKVVTLGYFATPEEGHAAYCEAAKKFHGEFASVAPREQESL